MSTVPNWYPQWAKPDTRQKKGLIAAIAAVIILTCSAYSLFAKPYGPQIGWNGTFEPDWRLDIQGKNGAVASDTAQCSQMGVDVLKAGGSAADAAVQVCLCIGSMEPQSSGIGGGAFITIRFPNGTSFVIDARETAPATAHKHMYDADPLKAKFFGLASGVPGELAGLQALWEMGGRMPWFDLVEPVADLNKHGFAKGEAVTKMAAYFKEQLDLVDPKHFEHMISESDWCWLFVDHPKCRLKENPSTSSWIKRPQLAETLSKIARSGAKSFYEDDYIARNLVDITQRLGGILTLEDFANYSVVIKPALESKFLNHTIFTAPEPASGPALLMGLHAIEQLLPTQFNSTDSVAKDQDPVLLQRIVEVMKWMAAARSELGDPAFVSNPKVAEMLTEEWAARVVGNISDLQTLPSWRDYHPSFEINNPKGTTHFSVIDKDGMAVAMTTTVNLPFGNGVCDPVTGIVMNSEMDDFSIPYQKNSFELAPSVYNFVAPGKRPLSSTVPSVLVSPEGKVEMVVGAAGGSRILTAVFLAIVRVFGLELESLEAVAFPRYHHQLIPETLMLEPGFSPQIIAEWESRGHEIDQRLPTSAMNLIHRDSSGALHAIGDFYRKRGMGAAY